MILDSIAPQVYCTDSPEIIPLETTIHTLPHPVHKPGGAFWTSSYTPKKKWASAWIEWCYEFNFKCGSNHFLITPKKGLKIFRPDDIKSLKSLPKEEGSFCGITIYPVTVDFAWYADEGYDGFHLEPEDVWMGFWDFGAMPPFKSWDCESTAWFNYNWIERIDKL